MGSRAGKQAADLMDPHSEKRFGRHWKEMGVEKTAKALRKEFLVHLE